MILDYEKTPISCKMQRQESLNSSKVFNIKKLNNRNRNTSNNKIDDESIIGRKIFKKK